MRAMTVQYPGTQPTVFIKATWTKGFLAVRLQCCIYSHIRKILIQRLTQYQMFVLI